MDNENYLNEVRDKVFDFKGIGSMVIKEVDEPNYSQNQYRTSYGKIIGSFGAGVGLSGGGSVQGALDTCAVDTGATDVGV